KSRQLMTRSIQCQPRASRGWFMSPPYSISAPLLQTIAPQPPACIPLKAASCAFLLPGTQFYCAILMAVLSLTSLIGIIVVRLVAYGGLLAPARSSAVL